MSLASLYLLVVETFWIVSVVTCWTIIPKRLNSINMLKAMIAMNPSSFVILDLPIVFCALRALEFVKLLRFAAQLLE